MFLKNFILLFFFVNFQVYSSEIAVVTMAIGEEYIKTVSLGLKNKADYCAKHGYEFICFQKSLDTSRSIPWSKILLILEVMEKEECNWIFWTDADSLVMNTALGIEELIDENYDLIISNDHNGFNSGHFLIRNCEWSRRFLLEVYSREDFINDIEWEQGAMLATLESNSHYQVRKKVIPQRLMNSYPELLGNLLHVTYQAGDFILHFAGVRNPTVLKNLFEYYYPLVIDQIDFLSYAHYLGIYGVLDMPKYPSYLDWSIDARNRRRVNWSTAEQNQQYIEQLNNLRNVNSIAQIGLSNGELAEIFLENSPHLTRSTAFVFYKRYDIYVRAACDYLSRKYRLIWNEAIESLEEIQSGEPYDLIHIQPRSINTIIQAKKLAGPETLLWINDYNVPFVQEILMQAIELDLIEIKRIHESGLQRDYRAWVEAKYK